MKKVEADDAGLRLDRWFKRHYPNVTHGQLEKWLRTGQVRVDGGRSKAATRLEAGQEVRVPPMADDAAPRPRAAKPVPAVSRSDASELEAMVIYRDDQVIILDKPPGLAVQGGSGITRHLDGMLDALRFDAKERPKLVHRTDKDTSGILVLARDTRSATALTAAFRSREARKLYWAVVVGVPKLFMGRIDMSIAKQPGRGGEKMTADDEGQRAITLYRVVEKAGRRAAWLAMEPLTGRTHQLRVHCAEALNTPILGDGKYGGQQAFLEGEGISRKLHLHARAIRVPHPKGGIIEASAPLPRHMQDTWKFFGFDAEGREAGFWEE